MKIILVGCGNKKLDVPSPASDLYIGKLFRLSWAYAESLQPDSIFILSALHHLLNPEEIVVPYDETLNGKSNEIRQAWSETIVNELEDMYNLVDDEFILLAGKDYTKFLSPQLGNALEPLIGLRMGERLQFLKNELNE